MKQLYSIESIINRANGKLNQVKFRNDILNEYIKTLKIDKSCEIKSPHLGNPIYSIDLDNIENRYLLSGSANFTIGLHDLEGKYEEVHQSNKEIHRYNAMFNSGQGPRTILNEISNNQTFHENINTNMCAMGHCSQVSNVKWFPNDNGIFFSGSFDSRLKIWDTNQLKCVTEFLCGGKIYSMELSKISKCHNLIAVGTNLSSVQLCDISTGASINSLLGHTSSVISIAWSPIDEFLLSTGSSDMSVRLWDIRKTGKNSCLSIFDSFSSYENNNSNKKRKLVTSTKSHDSIINSLKFTSNGLHLISCSVNDKIRLWNVSNGKDQSISYSNIKNNKRLSSIQLETVQFGSSVNNSYFFYPNKNGEILLYNTFSKDGKPCMKIFGHFGAVYSIIYRHKYDQLISCGEDGLIQLYNNNNNNINQISNNQIEINDNDNWSD